MELCTPIHSSRRFHVYNGVLSTKQGSVGPLWGTVNLMCLYICLSVHISVCLSPYLSVSPRRFLAIKAHGPQLRAAHAAAV